MALGRLFLAYNFENMLFQRRDALHASHTDAKTKDACNASLRKHYIEGQKHAIKNISKIKELQK
jgi:hypothetical protein